MKSGWKLPFWGDEKDGSKETKASKGSNSKDKGSKGNKGSKGSKISKEKAAKGKATEGEEPWWNVAAHASNILSKSDDADDADAAVASVEDDEGAWYLPFGMEKGDANGKGGSERIKSSAPWQWVARLGGKNETEPADALAGTMPRRQQRKP